MNYLNSERGYAEDWAAYISAHDMTMEQALQFLRSINTNQERFLHIVDMDTYEAYSSFYPQGEKKIDTYLAFKGKNTDWDATFGTIMEQMFNDTDGEFNVLGKYRLQETRGMAVGVGTRVTLVTDGGKKDFLLLRIIPVDALKKAWVFSTEFSSAEVGIITNGGDYVIQSNAMKSQNFGECIRAYNFQDDYREVDALYTRLKNTDSGMLSYKNYRGEDCLWYYSSFGTDTALDILGVIDAKDLKPSVDVWYIVLLICGALILLVMIDGIYLIRINRRLIETARASEQASKAKTQFLSAMSHDIRIPLNAVSGMMEIARKNPEDAAHIAVCMEKGIHSGKQLLMLINDVLDISKIESGKLSLNPDRVALPAMIDTLTDTLKQDILQKRIQFESDCKDLPYPYAYVDRMRLSQIYMNLLSNAVKYTDSDGKVILHIHEEPIPNRTAHTRLVFCVQDTGIGMAAEFQKTMYNNFSREINTQVNSTQGTSLGLAIVKQMVDLMDGTITCESMPGVGTTFTVKVDLPILEEEEEAVEDETAQSVEDMHLLVAEDNELNWEIFNELASGYGILSDRAKNGQECVDMLMKAPPDTYNAILMDVNMPIMNGYQATQAIRALSEEKRRDIPIIAMTADAFAEDVQACLDAGMNGHIAKPVDMNKLIAYFDKNKQL